MKKSHIFKVYGATWGLAVLTFWLFYQNSQMSLFNIIAGQYVILPIVTFILSIFIGKKTALVKDIWRVLICFSRCFILCLRKSLERSLTL